MGRAGNSATMSNNGRYVIVGIVGFKCQIWKPASGVSACDDYFQILEAIMDIMQVLQIICKNPEAHDKGTEVISRVSLRCHYLPTAFFKSFIFPYRIPVQVHCTHPPGCSQSFWTIQQHRRTLTLQALPSAGCSCPALCWWDWCRPAAVLQWLPLHPAQPFAHGVSGRHSEA